MDTQQDTNQQSHATASKQKSQSSQETGKVSKGSLASKSKSRENIETSTPSRSKDFDSIQQDLNPTASKGKGAASSTPRKLSQDKSATSQKEPESKTEQRGRASTSKSSKKKSQQEDKDEKIESKQDVRAVNEDEKKSKGKGSARKSVGRRSVSKSNAKKEPSKSPSKSPKNSKGKTNSRRQSVKKEKEDDKDREESQEDKAKEPKSGKKSNLKKKDEKDNEIEEEKKDEKASAQKSARKYVRINTMEQTAQEGIKYLMESESKKSNKGSASKSPKGSTKKPTSSSKKASKDEIEEEETKTSRSSRKSKGKSSADQTELEVEGKKSTGKKPSKDEIEEEEAPRTSTGRKSKGKSSIEQTELEVEKEKGDSEIEEEVDKSSRSATPGSSKSKSQSRTSSKSKSSKTRSGSGSKGKGKSTGKSSSKSKSPGKRSGSGKKKVVRTRTMKATVEEGNKFLKDKADDAKSKKRGSATTGGKMKRTGTMKETLKEGEEFLNKDKGTRKSTSRSASRSSSRRGSTKDNKNDVATTRSMGKNAKKIARKEQEKQVQRTRSIDDTISKSVGREKKGKQGKQPTKKQTGGKKMKTKENDDEDDEDEAKIEKSTNSGLEVNTLMNKTSAVNQNPIDPTQKDTLHGKKKSGPSRDSHSEAQGEDSDTKQGYHSKNTSHFDYSNLSLFFGARTGPMKSPNEGIMGKVHSKKKSNETCSSGGGTLKHPSSKDYSNLDELFENTTIIPNPTETKPHFKKRSNEIAVSKNQSDDNTDPMGLDAALFKNHLKKKSREKSFSNILKNAKEDKIEQEIAADISKLGFNMDDDQDKGEFTSFKDIKASKNNLKVLERIKNKALHHRNGAINVNVSETPKTTSTVPLESRTNNTSVFQGFNVSKLTKAISPIILNYKDKEIYNDENNDQAKYINELFENPKKNDNSEDIPLDKSKEISRDDLNPKLLTEKTASKNTKKVAELNIVDSSKGNRKKPNFNLSLISTDSTIDSENFTLLHDHQNNSFSTPFSGASGSFNNSGKLDFSSPGRIDSGRMNSENSETYLKNYSIQKNLNMMNPRMSMMPPPIQGMPPMNLNQSCMSFCGGYGSGNNSDRSTNLSFNEEYLTTSFNTPQVRQQPQNFLNQSFNVSSNPNVMEQFFIAPQAMPTDPSSFMMNQSMNQTDRANYATGGKSGNQTPSDQKNPSSRSRRKTQEAEDSSLYEIDVNKIEASGRTTLMVRNIPNKYDLTLILQTIDKNHKGKFDFFYLPIDFSNRCNFGYAFINFSNPKHIKDFYTEFHGKKWEKFNSEKICEIRYARIQGYHALMQHFQYSRVMNQQDKKLRPYIPPKYGLPNKSKIEELIRQQKLESARNDRQADSKRQGK